MAQIRIPALQSRSEESIAAPSRCPEEEGAMGATLFDKIWSQHRLAEDEGGKTLLYIDRVVVDDVRAPQVLKNLERRALAIRRPDLAVVVQDHSVPSFQTHTGLGGSVFVDATREAARRHGLRLLDVGDAEQGISHVVLPELGLVLPGSTYLCVDSHSPTVGGAGAIGLACGSTELEHVLATQAMWVRKPRQMRLTLGGALGEGVYAKDIILYLIGRLGIEMACGVALALAPASSRLMRRPSPGWRRFRMHRGARCGTAHMRTGRSFALTVTRTSTS